MKKLKCAIIFMVVLIIVLVIIGISTTMARYRSKGDAVVETGVAFYVVKDTYQEERIFLKDLQPSATPFNYSFTVSNIDEDGHIAETSINYSVKLEITTNLPLQFKIYKNDIEMVANDEINNVVELDSSRLCYIRNITINKGHFNFNSSTTDTYIVSATFPESYRDNEEFEGMIDNINIKLTSSQGEA